MVECTVQQPSYGSPYALDFFQSAIDTIHYALPFLRLNGDEARFSGHQLQTENGRGSCGGHTAEELYFLAGVFFSDQEPWPTYSQEEVPLYISVME